MCQSVNRAVNRIQCRNEIGGQSEQFLPRQTEMSAESTDPSKATIEGEDSVEGVVSNGVSVPPAFGGVGEFFDWFSATCPAFRTASNSE